MIHFIGSARFNLVVLLIFFLFTTILLKYSWTSPQDSRNGSLQDINGILEAKKVDISSELKADKEEVARGQTITYSFIFKNIGEDIPKNLYFTFYAPNDFFQGIFHDNFTRFVRIDYMPPGVSHDSTIVTNDGRNLLKTIHWSMDSLTTTAEQRIEFTVRVDDSLKKSITLTGIMTLTCDPDFVNQNSVDVPIILIPELNVQKYVSPAGPYIPGDEGVYTIDYSNKGERAIESVVVKDCFPANLILGQMNPPPDTVKNDTLFWYIGTLEVEESGTITILFQVDPDYQVPYPRGVFINRVDIKSGQYKDDAIASFNVIAADIDAKIEPLPEFYSPGYPIELKASIKNIGRSPIRTAFNVAFYFNEINVLNQIGDKIVIDSLKEDSRQTEIVTRIWDNPPEGDHTVIVYADCDTVIPELTEVNNIDRTLAHVQISELNVYTNEMNYYDNAIRRIAPNFPDNVFAYLSVLDQNLHPVRKLGSPLSWISQDDTTEFNVELKNIWTLSEDENPVNSLLVTEILPNAGFPISTAIVIPQSKSNILTVIKAELANFVVKFDSTKDQFSVVSYTNHLVSAQPFSADFDNVTNAIVQESDVSPRALFDAIYRGVAETAKQPGRRAVIAVTDGNNFSFIRADKVIEYANRLSVPVFVLHYGTANQPILQSLADSCGGLYFDVTSTEMFPEIFQKLYDILNNYYVVSYKSPINAMDETWRPLFVSIKYPNYLEPVGENNQGRYLAPANSAEIWMDIASFPSGLKQNASGQLWKLTQKEEQYEYVITFSNRGNNRVENISLDNWKSPYVDVATSLNPDYIAEMGQNYVLNFTADVKTELPLQWLSIIDSAKIHLNQQLMATASDTVWLIQDLKPEIRVVHVNQPYPATEEHLRITLIDTIMFWVSWPMYLQDFSIKLIPFQQNEIDFTDEILNMPQFPVAPETLAIEPNYKPPKKFTDLEEEQWIVRLEYEDQLNQSGSVETMFFILAPNKLILDKNVVRNGERGGENLELIVFISKENQVKIDVFNVAGEHIKNIEDRFYAKDSEATTTGKHLIWDCRDKNGRVVGSDVYIIIMEAGNYKTWKKVIVVN